MKSFEKIVEIQIALQLQYFGVYMNTSANKTALTASVNQIAALVATRDTTEANKSITAFGDMYGDKMVPTLLKQLPPTVVSVLLADEATKPTSLIDDLIAPATFAAAFEELPKKWGKQDASLAIRDIETLIVGIVMKSEDENCYPRAKELFKALTPTHNGKMLAWWLMQYKADIVIFARKRKWQKTGNETTFNQCLTELTGTVDFGTLLADESSNFDESEGWDDISENKEQFHYCSCPEHIKKTIERMPPELLQKVVNCWGAWTSKQINSIMAYESLLPKVKKQKSIGDAKKTTAQSAL
jgi:hypothetical protein